MCKIKLTSHKKYLFGRLFSIKANKTYTEQSTLRVFLLCPNRNVAKTAKQLQKLFSPVCMI